MGGLRLLFFYLEKKLIINKLFIILIIKVYSAKL